MLTILYDILYASCRFDFYLGAKHHENEVAPTNNKTEPAAVVRNMEHVLKNVLTSGEWWWSTDTTRRSPSSSSCSA